MTREELDAIEARANAASSASAVSPRSREGGGRVITVDEIMACSPCANYPRERVAGLIGAGKTPAEIAALDIPSVDKVWCLAHILARRDGRALVLWACGCVRQRRIEPGSDAECALATAEAWTIGEATREECWESADAAAYTAAACAARAATYAYADADAAAAAAAAAYAAAAYAAYAAAAAAARAADATYADAARAGAYAAAAYAAAEAQQLARLVAAFGGQP